METVPKFKVGDRVQVNAEGFWTCRTGAVRHYDTAQRRYVIDLDDGEDGYAKEKSLELLVAPAAPQAPFEIIPPLPSRPSVRVTLTAEQVAYLTDLVGQDETSGEVPRLTYRLLRDVEEALGQ